MGMASGVFEADMERAKLRQQAANNAATQALNWRKQQLAEREYEDKRKARERDEALDKERYDRRMKLYERELDEKGAREDRKLDYEMRRQDRLDALAERKYALQEAEQQAKYEKQRAIYDGYAQLGKQAKQQQMARQESGATALASVMKLAMGNGGANPKTGKKSKGMVPRYALEALNRDMGFDGQNQGFVSGGYTANGDFFLEYAQKDPQTGQMVTTPQVITPIDQFKIMNKQRGVFTKQDCGEMAAQLKGAGYRNDEIMLASGIDQSQLEQIKNAAKQVNAKKAARNSDLKTRLEAIKMLQEYKAGNLNELDEATQKSLTEAINNVMMDITQNINQQFLQKKQMQQMQATKGAGLPVYDAQSNTLTLPDGTILRKNQEWTDPESGNKFVWRGDNAKNFESLNPMNAQYDNNSYEEYKRLQSSGVLSSDVDIRDYMRMKEQGVEFSTELKQAKEPSPYVAGEGMSNVNDTSIAGYTKNIYNKLSNSGLLDTSKLGFKDFADLVGMSDEDNDSLKPKLPAREKSDAKDKTEYPALSGVENQNTEGEPPLPAHGQYGYNSSEEGEEESYEMPEDMEEYLMSFEE